MPGQDDERTTVKRAVDACVLVPIGLAAAGAAKLPHLVGRAHDQVQIARVVGRFAVQKGAALAEGALEQVQQQAADVLRSVGLDLDGRTEPAEEATSTGPAGPTGDAGLRPSDQDLDADFDADEVTAPVPVADVAPMAQPDAVSGNGATALASDEQPAPAPEPAIDVEGLAIPDYDSLSASQVVPRLESLQDDELEAVRGYEASTRGRKTILSKIAQLQSM